MVKEERVGATRGGGVRRGGRKKGRFKLKLEQWQGTGCDRRKEKVRESDVVGWGEDPRGDRMGGDLCVA